MARVKHTLQNGVVHLRQQNSGKLAAIDVSLYEYINEEDKPSDEYVFRNGGASSFSFTANGGTETSTITSQYGHEGSWSNVPFSCTEKPEWVTVNTTATSVSVKADENEDTSIRAGSVVLTQDTSNKKITIAISQAAAEGAEPGPGPQDEWIFTADKTSFSFDAESGGDSLISGLQTDGTTITSTHNGSWVDFTIDGGSALGGAQKFDNWLIVTKTHESGNTATLAIGVTKNTSDESRSQSFTLTQGDGSSNSITITVTQDAKEDEEPETATYYLNITPSSHTFDYNGGDLNLQIESYSEKGGVQTPERWKLKSDEEANWITGQDTECSGTKTQEITLHCASYDDTTQRRSCNITFEQETIQPTEKTAMVTLTQTAKPEETTYSLVINPDTVSFSPGGGKSSNITITSKKHTGSSDENFHWKYVSGAATWVSGYPTSGTDLQTFQIDCQNNDTYTERQCTLRYAQEDPGTATATLRIVQSGMSLPVEHTYVFDIDPSTLTFNSDSSSKDVKVTSTKDGDKWDWSITAGSDNDWCHLSKTDAGVTVSVDANKTNDEATSPRSLEVTLSQQDSGRQANINVNQEGYTLPIPEKYTYTFNVNPDNAITFPVRNVEDIQLTVRSYKTGDQSGVVELDFTHTEDSEWIKVSGDGGNLIVSADDNTTGADRNGTIDFKQSEQDETGAQKSVVISVTQKGSEDIGA